MAAIYAVFDQECRNRLIFYCDYICYCILDCHTWVIKNQKDGRQNLVPNSEDLQRSDNKHDADMVQRYKYA